MKKIKFVELNLKGSEKRTSPAFGSRLLLHGGSLSNHDVIQICQLFRSRLLQGGCTLSGKVNTVGIRNQTGNIKKKTDFCPVFQCHSETELAFHF